MGTLLSRLSRPIMGAARRVPGAGRLLGPQAPTPKPPTLGALPTPAAPQAPANLTATGYGQGPSTIRDVPRTRIPAITAPSAGPTPVGGAAPASTIAGVRGGAFAPKPESAYLPSFAKQVGVDAAKTVGLGTAGTLAGMAAAPVAGYLGANQLTQDTLANVGPALGGLAGAGMGMKTQGMKGLLSLDPKIMQNYRPGSELYRNMGSIGARSAIGGAAGYAGGAGLDQVAGHQDGRFANMGLLAGTGLGGMAPGVLNKLGPNIGPVLADSSRSLGRMGLGAAGLAGAAPVAARAYDTGMDHVAKDLAGRGTTQALANIKQQTGLDLQGDLGQQVARQVIPAVETELGLQPGQAKQIGTQVGNLSQGWDNFRANPLEFATNTFQGMNPTQKAMLGMALISGMSPMFSGRGGMAPWAMGLGGAGLMGLGSMYYPQLAQQMGWQADPMSALLPYLQQLLGYDQGVAAAPETAAPTT
jgi:hypothetical protein